MEDSLIQYINHSVLSARELYFTNIIDFKEMVNEIKQITKQHELKFKHYSIIKDLKFYDVFEGILDNESIFILEVLKVE